MDRFDNYRRFPEEMYSLLGQEMGHIYGCSETEKASRTFEAVEHVAEQSKDLCYQWARNRRIARGDGRTPVDKHPLEWREKHASWHCRRREAVVPIPCQAGEDGSRGFCRYLIEVDIAGDNIPGATCTLQFIRGCDEPEEDLLHVEWWPNENTSVEGDMRQTGATYYLGEMSFGDIKEMFEDAGSVDETVMLLEKCAEDDWNLRGEIVDA